MFHETKDVDNEIKSHVALGDLLQDSDARATEAISAYAVRSC